MGTSWQLPEIETHWEAPVPRGLGKRKTLWSRAHSRLLPSHEHFPAAGQQPAQGKPPSPGWGSGGGGCWWPWEPSQQLSPAGAGADASLAGQ